MKKCDRGVSKLAKNSVTYFMDVPLAYPSQRSDQPLGPFISTSFGHQYVLSLKGEISCLAVSCLPIASSVVLCRYNSFHGVFVFVFSYHHMTVSSQSGFSYFQAINQLKIYIAPLQDPYSEASRPNACHPATPCSIIWGTRALAGR